MLLNKHTPSVTTAGAIWSGNMPILSSGVLCRQIYVKSTTIKVSALGIGGAAEAAASFGYWIE